MYYKLERQDIYHIRLAPEDIGLIRKKFPKE